MKKYILLILIFILITSIISATPLKIQLCGLPPVLYTGERLNFIIKITNTTSTYQECKYILEGIKTLCTQKTLHLKPSASKCIIQPIQVEKIPSMPVTLTIRIKSHTTQTRYILLLPHMHDLDSITIRNNALFTTSGIPVIIISEYENEYKHREWWIYKAIRKKINRGRKKLLICTRIDQPDIKEYTPYYMQLTASDITTYTLPDTTDYTIYWLYLNIDRIYRKYRPGHILIGTFDMDIENRIPLRTYRRILIEIIRRLRKESPYIAITLLTPFPDVINQHNTETYTKLLHTISTTMHTDIIDIHKYITDKEDWKKHYRYQGEPLYYRYPLQKIQEEITELIKDRL